MQVFVKSPDEDYFGQAPVGMKKGIKEFLAMRNMVEDISSDQKENMIIYSWIG